MKEQYNIRNNVPNGKRMKFSMKSIRACLKRNEPFLRLAEVLIFAIAGGILAFASYRIQKSQGDIVLYEHLPLIRIDDKLRYDEAVRIYTDEVIEVINEGYVVQDADADVFCFLEVEVLDPPRPLVKLQLAIDNYYSATIPTNVTRGVLFTFLGDKNNNAMVDLVRSFYKAVHSKNIYATLSLEEYVKVTYKDFSGKKYKEYFKVDAVHDGTHISVSSGEALFSKHRQSLSNNEILHFGKLTAEQLVKMLAAKINEKK